MNYVLSILPVNRIAALSALCLACACGGGATVDVGSGSMTGQVSGYGLSVRSAMFKTRMDRGFEYVTIVLSDTDDVCNEYQQGVEIAGATRAHVNVRRDNGPDTSMRYESSVYVYPTDGRCESMIGASMSAGEATFSELGYDVVRGSFSADIVTDLMAPEHVEGTFEAVRCPLPDEHPPYRCVTYPE